MFIPKYFREVKWYKCTESFCCLRQVCHQAGRSEAERLCLGHFEQQFGKGVFGVWLCSWYLWEVLDHASKGQENRCLKAFRGCWCPRAEMCIWVWGAEVRLDDKGNQLEGPHGTRKESECRPLTQQLEGVWCTTCSAGRLLGPVLGVTLLFSVAHGLIRVGTDSRWAGTQWGLLHSKSCLGILEALFA